MELCLRPYEPGDAAAIASWIQDEAALRLWSAACYPGFPVTEADINERYLERNGGCPEPDSFWPIMAFDGGGAAGHFVLRFTDAKRQTVRLGFVIVDGEKRGQGYGRELVRLALHHAFGCLGARRVTLGVFAQNQAAYRCYRAAGFRETGRAEWDVCGERWTCIEMEMTCEGIERGSKEGPT